MMTSIKVCILFLTLVFGSACFGQVSLERVKVTKDISMEIPTSFVPMNQGDRVNKYVSSRVPIAMYTSVDRQVDLGINENSSTWAATDYALLKDFHRANILNLFDEVDFIQEEIQEIAGRKYVVYEFVGRITDEGRTVGNQSSVSRYNYIMYTIRNNKVLLFNFTCPIRFKSTWQETAGEIMRSIRLK